MDVSEENLQQNNWKFKTKTHKMNDEENRRGVD